MEVGTPPCGILSTRAHDCTTVAAGRAYGIGQRRTACHAGQHLRLPFAREIPGRELHDEPMAGSIAIVLAVRWRVKSMRWLQNNAGVRCTIRRIGASGARSLAGSLSP